MEKKMFGGNVMMRYMVFGKQEKHSVEMGKDVEIMVNMLIGDEKDRRVE